MHFSGSGYSHAAVRDGFLLRRLKGACVESCFKEMAVRKSKAKQPTVYRCQKYEGADFEERADPDVLAEVWKATTAARNALRKDDYKVVYAQSTYVSSLSDDTLATAPRQKTRSQGKFSVDLTVERANQTVWLETQLNGQLNLAPRCHAATCIKYVSFLCAAVGGSSQCKNICRSAVGQVAYQNAF